MINPATRLVILKVVLGLGILMFIGLITGDPTLTILSRGVKSIFSGGP